MTSSSATSSSLSSLSFNIDQESKIKDTYVPLSIDTVDCNITN